MIYKKFKETCNLHLCLQYSFNKSWRISYGRDPIIISLQIIAFARKFHL